MADGRTPRPAGDTHTAHTAVSVCTLRACLGQTIGVVGAAITAAAAAAAAATSPSRPEKQLQRTGPCAACAPPNPAPCIMMIAAETQGNLSQFLS
jgi:hypothetical protein